MIFIIERDVPVAARDGVVLATDVYRTEGAPPRPTILMRTPYSKDSPALVNTWLTVLRAVEASWVVVVQDTRGRFRSGGDFEPFLHEAADGADTITWICSQAWSDGRVVMAGGSYVGATQWAAAGQRPEGLAAIAPAVTSADVRDPWIYEGGLMQSGFVVSWVLGALAPVDVRRREDSEALLGQIAKLGAIQDELLAASRSTIASCLEEIAPYVRGWFDHPCPDTYWAARTPLDGAVPAFVIAGWYDIFLLGSLRSWTNRSAVTPEIRARDRLLIGPWSHGALGGWFDGQTFGPTSGQETVDITGQQLEWFASVLGGTDSSTPRVQLFVMGANEWRAYSDWPPVEGVQHEIALVPAGGRISGGSLNDASDWHDGVVKLRHDADTPVPTVGGRTYLPGLFVAANAGPRDQSEIQGLDAVASFESEEWEAVRELVGPVALALAVRGTGRATVVAKLTLVDPDGSSRLLCEGSRTVEEQHWTGVMAELVIDLGGTAVRIPTGCRLRVNLSLSDSPRLENPEGGAVVEIAGTQSTPVLHVWQLP